MYVIVRNCLVVYGLDRYVMLLADMENQHLGDGQFWRKPVGTSRRFDDLFIDSTADFIRWSRHIGVWEGDKAVYRGNAYVIRWIWLTQPTFLLQEVECLPLNWTYWYRLWSNTHTFRRSLGFIAYLHILGRWKLLGGVEIGSVSCVLGWYMPSIFWGRSVLEDAGCDLEALRWPNYRPLFLILFSKGVL